ncbi:hypothetical protein TNCV_4368371 [Trichonephila clavipes]|nr:hypothetical protein TNCV_4368371 [Trichonephila clavipes]
MTRLAHETYHAAGRTLLPPHTMRLQWYQVSNQRQAGPERTKATPPGSHRSTNHRHATPQKVQTPLSSCPTSQTTLTWDCRLFDSPEKKTYSPKETHIQRRRSHWSVADRSSWHLHCRFTSRRKGEQ